MFVLCAKLRRADHATARFIHNSCYNPPFLAYTRSQRPAERRRRGP
jgi:hypothetical protein